MHAHSFGRRAGGKQARLTLAAAVIALALPSSATASLASAREFAQGRAGTVSFAYVDDDGRLHGYQPNLRYRSASLVKAMILVAYLRRVSWGHLPLDGAARAQLGPMITRSDNIAANWAYDRVGRGPTLDALARRAGMSSFAAASYWAYSMTSARDQVAFFARLERLTPPAHRAYALGLLRRIVPAQRWGIPRAAPGWRLYLQRRLVRVAAPLAPGRAPRARRLPPRPCRPDRPQPDRRVRPGNDRGRRPPLTQLAVAPDPGRWRSAARR